MSDRTPLLAADHVVSIEGKGPSSRNTKARKVVSKPEGVDKSKTRFNRLNSIALPAFDPQEKNASPFVSTTPVGRYEAIKMLVFSCLLIPIIKAILVVFMIFMC
jgi:hypothetical protein